MIYNKTSWYRTSNGLYYKESYLKGRFSDRTNLNLISSVNVNLNFFYDLNVPSSYTSNSGVIKAIKNVIERPKSEAEVDALTATLFVHLFKYDEGYLYCPQSYDSNILSTRSGKCDYKVTHLDNPIVIVENKHSKGDS